MLYYSQFRTEITNNMPSTFDDRICATTCLEREIKDYDKNNSWHVVYGRMKNNASLEHMACSVKEARRPENRKRNRYRDVHPYDHSRIVLHRGETDYINANLAEVSSINTKYILTQGPLDHTKTDFWEMIWEQNTKAILMLNRIMEKGSVKCSQYWPEMDKQTYGDLFRVTIINESDRHYFILRTFELYNLQTNSSREIYHFHYTTWPDFGVPESPKDFLDFLLAVRLSGSLSSSVGPAVIHCSAGIGRSGTFCLVDSCLMTIARTGDPDSVNVLEMLIHLRSYRMGLIQTPDQLRFSYLAIVDGTNRLFSPDDAFSALLDQNRTEDFTESTRDVAGATPEMTDEGALIALETDPEVSALSVAFDGSVTTSDSTDSHQTAAADNSKEIRRRNREERQKQTREQIERMRRRQKESSWYRERWWRRYVNLPTVSLGISLAVAVIGGVVYYMTNRMS